MEAHLLTHLAVNDCTVIPVPDERSGEVPKAFVVKSASVKSKSDEELLLLSEASQVCDASYVWLQFANVSSRRVACKYGVPTLF